MPEAGLRCQCIAATGSGKTLIAAATAQRLGARRVLVLVPTLDLLVQMATAWRRDGGRSGPIVGVCSLPAKDSGGLPCTTDEAVLAAWVRDLETVTLFGTYASVDVVRKAHALGLEEFGLVVVDGAHRTSGDGLKPWAAVHDQDKLRAVRRLYMTATTPPDSPTRSPRGARPGSRSGQRRARSPRSGAICSTTSTPAGARPGTPDGNAACASCRRTWPTAGACPRRPGTSWSRAKTSDGGSPHSATTSSN
ncbi:DEAD/DEAH box helicase family protein [Streptomyces sp. NPDC102406]|uniref:DEAD/DEAH box helicase family protein n=1 Tax=Streptomyces sp. NPDC102406 TaxID=3366171 RepID=UPI0037F74DF8